MRHMKEIATAAGTLVIAVGVGFVMQSSESAEQHYGKSARPIVTESNLENDDSDSVLSDAVSADILLQVKAVELTSASEASGLSIPSDITNVERTSASITDQPPELDALPEGQHCEASAHATAIPGALVNLSLNAPCAPNERLTVHHNGMIFTETTDDAGQLSFTVPALTEQAVFIMAFSNGSGAVAQIDVLDIDDFDRTVLQWRGQSGFELHAREFGAGYGDAGHVWSGGDQNIAGLITGETGLLLRLGDNLSAEPLLAEVYSFRSATSAHVGLVDLSIEAEVTSTNCGLEIEAQSLEKIANGKMKTHDLTLAVPDCDTIGTFLVLNNLVEDLKVASN
ncbi:MAG: hypothetical protein ABJR46_05330 [Tateyamaria sp.]|uniref:hypothetical protein n=1 Tax=Tateyamaria sp. TaxID=1929288 RepID=UPI00329DDE0D